MLKLVNILTAMRGLTEQIGDVAERLDGTDERARRRIRKLEARVAKIESDMVEVRNRSEEQEVHNA